MKALRTTCLAGVVAAALAIAAPAYAGDLELDLAGDGFADSSTVVTPINTMDWANMEGGLTFSLSGTDWTTFAGSATVGDTISFDTFYASYLIGMTGNGVSLLDSGAGTMISTDGGLQDQAGNDCFATGMCWELNLVLDGSITAEVTDVTAGEVLLSFTSLAGDMRLMLDAHEITADDLTDGVQLLLAALECDQVAGCGQLRIGTNGNPIGASDIEFTGLISAWDSDYLRAVGGLDLLSTRFQSTASLLLESICDGCTEYIFDADGSSQFSTVPEPGTLLLVALGLLGATAGRRLHARHLGE